ncbi:MAG: glycosyltransferase [Candidatus Omnitrophica bacterium]|nr:glycosyltransferase [Candidatus Omnitrophota bacterium]
MTANSNLPKVAIVIVPRERFSLVKTCVEHIYAHTREPFELFVIDPNSPNWLYEWLKKWERKNSNMHVLRSERFLYPYEAKNMVAKHLRAEIDWVVFLDNDVKVSPHWLTWLLDAARETGVRALHPLYLIEQKGGDLGIHMADGIIRKGKKNGRDVIQPVMNYVGMSISNAAKFHRQESGFVEFHTFMIRRDLLEEMGEFEPLTLSEDVHYSLRLREKGERIVFEPRSVVTYVAGPPFEKYDLAYFRFRWKNSVAEASIERLKPRWPAVDGYWDGKLAWMNYHKNRIEPWFPIVAKYRDLAAQSRTIRRIGRLIPIFNKV